MQRIDTSTKFTDLFGPGKHGFRDGNKATFSAPTQLNAAWTNSIQEEICGFIEGFNETLDPDNNQQMYDVFRKVTGGMLSKSVAGGSNVTLTALESRYSIIDLSDPITADIAVIVPTATGKWIFRNSTSGAFKITVKTAAGTGVVVLPGTSLILWCDGTNVNATMLPLGYNQTNQNMLASRAPSTTYTNPPASSGGRPIFVHIRASSDFADSWLIATLTTIDGATLTYSSASQHNINFGTNVAFVVLPGETYRANMVSGTTTLIEWNELR